MQYVVNLIVNVQLKHGRVIETPWQLFRRVGKAVTAVEIGYPSSLLPEDEARIRKDGVSMVRLRKK